MTPSRRGFTLIEILLVLAVLSLLLVMLLPRFGEFLSRGKVQETRALAQELAGMIDSYNSESGDYPSCSYKGLPAQPPNDTNTGTESLVAFLAAPTYDGPKPKESTLLNSDEDRFPRKVTEYAVDDAFEVRDAWGNPFAYFHAAEYERKQSYRCEGEAGPGGDEEVEARRSKKTGNFLRPQDYQVISAGRDGEFGTSDDLVYGDEP